MYNNNISKYVITFFSVYLAPYLFREPLSALIFAVLYEHGSFERSTEPLTTLNVDTLLTCKSLNTTQPRHSRTTLLLLEGCAFTRPMYVIITTS